MVPPTIRIASGGAAAAMNTLVALKALRGTTDRGTTAAQNTAAPDTELPGNPRSGSLLWHAAVLLLVGAVCFGVYLAWPESDSEPTEEQPSSPTASPMEGSSPSVFSRPIRPLDTDETPTDAPLSHATTITGWTRPLDWEYDE